MAVKKTVTYGVDGMLDYQALIMIGRNAVRIMFTGGMCSGMGVKPAEYKTDNAVMQHAIEQSAGYKSGKIYKVAEEVEQSTAEAENEEAESEDTNDYKKEECRVHTVKEVSTNDDARDYLEEQFGEPRTPLRVRADIVACGQRHGVEFKFPT